MTCCCFNLTNVKTTVSDREEFKLHGHLTYDGLGLHVITVSDYYTQCLVPDSKWHPAWFKQIHNECKLQNPCKTAFFFIFELISYDVYFQVFVCSYTLSQQLDDSLCPCVLWSVLLCPVCPLFSLVFYGLMEPKARDLV